MINSIPINHPLPQNQGFGGSCPNDCKLGEAMEVEGEPHSHTRTVQALRKYLQRKLSSEDSSSERESQSPQENRSFENEEPKSTLTCSIVYSINSSGRNIFPLQKQRSLDDYPHSVPHPYTHSSAQTILDHRYLRTDLCVPVLLSRCTFCIESFELDSELREHMREKHWRYFFDNPPTCNFPQEQLQDSSATSEVLDLSMRKSTKVTGSLPNLSLMKSLSSNSLLGFGFSGGTAENGGRAKNKVKCSTCGKGFSTKWNWKQHQKIHLRENLESYQQ